MGVVEWLGLVTVGIPAVVIFAYLGCQAVISLAAIADEPDLNKRHKHKEIIAFAALLFGFFLVAYLTHRR